MSWDYLRAALALKRLPTLAKWLAVAMGDQATTDGRCQASVALLARLTGMSARTVQRQRDVLVSAGVCEVELRGGGRDEAVYRLILLPGVSARQGCQADTGVSDDKRGVSQSRVSDPFTDPKSTSRKAEPAARPPGQLTEEPTRDQLTKLAFVIVDDDATQVETRGDLEELVKRACARAGFRYNAASVNDAINRVIAARGFNPQHQVDLGEVRRCRRG